MNLRLSFRIVLLCLLFSSLGIAQSSFQLKTGDTELVFEAGASAPQLKTLSNTSSEWLNRAPASLIQTGEVSGKKFELHWSFNRAASHADAHVVSLVYDSSSPDLRLTWEWQARSPHGPIEHEIRIENRGNSDVWIPLQSSFVFDWQVPVAEKLQHFYVEKGADTPSAVGTHFLSVGDGYDWEGSSSTYAQPRPGEAREIIPYFLVQRADATESGWYVGIEFSGRTRLAAARKGDSLHGEVGLNPNPAPFRTRLRPGETFVTPRIFLGATSGGPDATGNVLRRWVREVLTNPHDWTNPKYPLLVNNSWGGGMLVDQSIAERMIRDSSDLGFEMFHIDAGWFRGVGDWYPDPKKFPHGLVPIANDLHARGMKLGLWVDWAQAGLDTSPGALNAQDPQVRDWMTVDLPADWKPEGFKGQTIDLGVPAAKAWVMRETNRIVSDYKLDMLEHDGYLVAKGCDATDHPHAAPDPLNRCNYRDSGFYFSLSSNSTDVSYHATRAYYEIQSNLHQKHPGLLLEVCNDGGRMVDFGSAAHGDYFSITDTYDPLSNRRAFYDTSFVLPSAMLEAYVERWPTPNLDNFRYMLRSGMMGWLSVMIDTSSWSAEQHAIAKEELALYKARLRPLIRDANLYHVSERPDGIHWDAIEYFEPRTHRGAIYVFHGSSETESTHRFILKGLEVSKRYRLQFHDHSSPDEIATGGDLMKAGLQVKLPGPNSSEIILLSDAQE